MLNGSTTIYVFKTLPDFKMPYPNVYILAVVLLSKVPSKWYQKCSTIAFNRTVIAFLGWHIHGALW